MPGSTAVSPKTTWRSGLPLADGRLYARRLKTNTLEERRPAFQCGPRGGKSLSDRVRQGKECKTVNKAEPDKAFPVHFRV